MPHMSDYGARVYVEKDKLREVKEFTWRGDDASQGFT